MQKYSRQVVIRSFLRKKQHIFYIEIPVAFCHLLIFQKHLFEKFLQEHTESVKRFGSRSGPTHLMSFICHKIKSKGAWLLTTCNELYTDSTMCILT